MKQIKTFTSYSVAVGLIIFGLCLRFGGEKFLIDQHFKKYNDAPNSNLLNLVKYGGVGLYIGGWLTLAVCLSLKHKGNKLLKHSIFSAILISVVWTVFEFKEEKFVTQTKLPLISISVLLSSLVALISLKYEIKDILLIIVASVLIIFAEYFVLPFQRNNGIHDGLGLPLLILGWFLLYYVFDGDSKVLRDPLVNLKLIN
jgi:membrane-bound ClpP family serine protease